MKNKLKNVLIFGATSDMAQFLINSLLDDGVFVYAVSRSKLELEHKNLFKFNLDLSLEEEINSFFSNLDEVQFSAVVNFQGIAISSPVEFLKSDQLRKQLDISLFSLLNILRNLNGKISNNGIVINISSMAAFGIFPFLAPYSISKASSDILLNLYEIETGIKTVSVKPGVVSTKFWEFCVNENRQNFENFKEKYLQEGEFIKNNALKNANKGVSKNDVSKLVYKILKSSNPKSSYLIGKDAYFASIASCFKGRLLFKIVRKILKMKIKRFKNEK